MSVLGLRFNFDQFLFDEIAHLVPATIAPMMIPALGRSINRHVDKVGIFIRHPWRARHTIHPKFAQANSGLTFRKRHYHDRTCARHNGPGRRCDNIDVFDSPASPLANLSFELYCRHHDGISTPETRVNLRNRFLGTHYYSSASNLTLPNALNRSSLI